MKYPLENIGALKLALTNLRTYQEALENEQQYAKLDEIMYEIKDIIESAEQ